MKSVRIPVPLPHIGSVNAWLLRGDPFTLVDTGPRDDEALAALEAGLAGAGVRVEDLELVLADPPPPGPHRPRRRRSRSARARVSRPWTAPPTTVRAYEHRAEADRRFSRALMRHHGVPDAVIDDNERFFGVHQQRIGGVRHRRVAGGRRPHPGGRPRPDRRRPARPQHHRRALRRRGRRHRVRGRPPARRGLLEHRDLPGRRTGRHPPARAYRVPGEPAAHGCDAARPSAHRPRRAGDRARAPDPCAGSASTSGAVRASSRCSRAGAQPRSRSPSTSGRRAPSREQPLLVVWEVLGHLDLLLDAGVVREDVTDDGSTYGVASFALIQPTTHRKEGAVLHEPLDSLTEPRQGSATDRFDLTDRVAVVTGGTRGLGLAMARGFAQAGAQVVIVSRKAEACDEVVAALRAEGARRDRRAPAMSGSGTACERAGRGRSTGDFGRHRRAGEQRRDVADVRQAHRRQRGAVRQADRGQPEGPVPARGAGRRADGRGPRRLDHQRLEHRRSAADARTSCRTPRRRPA